MKSRLRSLQTTSPQLLVIREQFEGSSRVEKALHYVLHEHRMAGEWFEDHPDVWSAIAAAASGCLWQADDWAPFALKMKAAGMSFAGIGELLGFSGEYVRQQIGANRPRQLDGCKVTSLVSELPDLSVREIAERLGCSQNTVRKHLPKKEKTLSIVTGIDKAIEAAGGETALGEVLGVTQQAVNKWKARGFPPAARVDQLANAFRIPREELIDPAVVQLVRGE